MGKSPQHVHIPGAKKHSHDCIHNETQCNLFSPEGRIKDHNGAYTELC